MLIMSITTERNQPMTMKNPPHPGGVVLRQCIEPLGLTITEAAEALGVARNTLSELVNGKRGISPEMAVSLSKVFGGTEDGWLVQQAQYELAHVRRDDITLKRLQLSYRRRVSRSQRQRKAGAEYSTGLVQSLKKSVSLELSLFGPAEA